MAKTILPTVLTKKAAGHRIIAMVKKTGSAMLNQALIALCAVTPTTKALLRYPLSKKAGVSK